MRKLIVGLMVGSLLAIAGPAMAKGGYGDPLTLAASGVLVPFFTSDDGSQNSIIEIASPVGDNLGLHMFFYNADCDRGTSLGRGVTENGVVFVRKGLLASQTGGQSGLAAIAQKDGTVLQPLQNPIHVRVYWENDLTGRGRVLEPITLFTAGIDPADPDAPLFTWNPLRTAVDFWSPPQDGSNFTTLFLICPKSIITDPFRDLGAFPSSAGFPEIHPRFRSSYPGPLSGPPLATGGSLYWQVYEPVTEAAGPDFRSGCNCLAQINLFDTLDDHGDVVPGGFAIDPIFADTVEYPFGTYTEITSEFADSDVAPDGGFPFTGYKALDGRDDTIVEFFGRLSNGNDDWIIDGSPGCPTDCPTNFGGR